MWFRASTIGPYPVHTTIQYKYMLQFQRNFYYSWQHFNAPWSAALHANISIDSSVSPRLVSVCPPYSVDILIPAYSTGTSYESRRVVWVERREWLGSASVGEEAGKD